MRLRLALGVRLRLRFVRRRTVDNEPGRHAARRNGAVRDAAAVLVVTAVIDDETVVRAAIARRMIRQVRRRVALVIAAVKIGTAIIHQNADTPFAARALRQTAGRFKRVVAEEIDEETGAEVPAHPESHDRAVVRVVAKVVEEITDGVVATEPATETLPTRLVATRTVVARRRGGVADIVPAEVASDADAHPVPAAVRKVVELVSVVPAAVEAKPDTAASDASNPGADPLAPTVVARVFRIRIVIVAADVIMIVPVFVENRAEPAGMPHSLRPQRGSIIVGAGAVDMESESAKRLTLRSQESEVTVVAAFVNENPDAADNAPLRDVFREVAVVPAAVVPSRDAENRAALNPGILADVIVVVRAEIQNDQHRAIDVADAFAVLVLPAEVDDATNGRILVEIPNVRALAAEQDIAGFGRDAPDVLPVDAHLFKRIHVDLRQQRERFFVERREDGFRGVVKRALVHFLHRVDQIFRATAARNGVSALRLRAEDRVRFPRNRRDVVFAHRRERASVQSRRFNERRFQRFDRFLRRRRRRFRRSIVARRDVHFDARQANAGDDVRRRTGEEPAPSARKELDFARRTQRVGVKFLVPTQTAASVQLASRLERRRLATHSGVVSAPTVVKRRPAASVQGRQQIVRHFLRRPSRVFISEGRDGRRRRFRFRRRRFGRRRGRGRFRVDFRQIDASVRRVGLFAGQSARLFFGGALFRLFGRGLLRSFRRLLRRFLLRFFRRGVRFDRFLRDRRLRFRRSRNRVDRRNRRRRALRRAPFERSSGTPRAAQVAFDLLGRSHSARYSQHSRRLLQRTSAVLRRRDLDVERRRRQFRVQP